jgi:anti-repressor protein
LNELIKIDKSGKTTARELYEFLELHPAAFARWCKTNIEENEFYQVDTDWQGFNIMLNGNESKDYHLTIDFAKHLCMLSRSDRGKQARSYFVEIEKQSNKQQVDIAKLSPELQMFKLIYDSVAKTQLDLVTMQEKTIQVERTLTLVKDTIIQRDDNWREAINSMVSRITKATVNKDYQAVRTESYQILEERAHCLLNTRLRNLKDRLLESGATKSKLNMTTKMDVIESDPKLKEIYTSVVKEMTIKYVA